MGKWLNGAQVRKREIDGKDTRIAALAAAGAAQIGMAVPAQAAVTEAALEQSRWQRNEYELYKETKKFVLKNLVMCLLNESNKDIFIDKIKGHYCMLGTSVGNLMCYFSNGCNLIEDSSTGIHSLIAHGRLSQFQLKI